MNVDSTVPQPPQGEWWSDEPQRENYLHLMQMIALITSLRWSWRDRAPDHFVGGNLTVYYSQVRRRSEDFRGPTSSSRSTSTARGRAAAGSCGRKADGIRT